MPTSFEPGVSPGAGFIPVSVPQVAGNEWKYIKECLDTGWVSSVGSYVDRFEQAVAGYVGTQHAVAMVNGTSALHIALLVAGVEPDDEVLVSALTFIAPANAVRYAGAWPVFIDAEPQYWQMDPDKVADFLANECTSVHGELRNKTSGRRVKALLPVDILGHPAELDALRALARQYGLAFVEDSTESLGAEYRGRRVGQDSDFACFSFNGNKLLTTGGGGMLVTDNPTWAQRARYLATQAKDDPVEYVHNAIGYNYRLSNIQAAMGCAQMEVIDEYIAKKCRIATAYREGLGELPGISFMPEAPYARSTHWMFTVRIHADLFGSSSREVLAALGRDRIQARPLWQPMHLSPAHAGAQMIGGKVAEELHRDALSLPCSVGLTDDEQQRVIDALRSYAEVAR